MTDQVNAPATDETIEVGEVETQSELATLKERARILGVQFSNNIKLETLREKVNAALTGSVVDEEPDTIAAQTAVDVLSQMRDENFRLVRVTIHCLNPAKHDLTGEVITVANSVLGELRYFVPYGERTDEGWHIPNWIYKRLKKKKFLQIRVRRDRNGNEFVTKNWVPEYSIQMLESLTEADLRKLAQAQLAESNAL